MEIIEDEVALDPDGNVDGGDDYKKVSCRLEFNRELCALEKANLCHLNVKVFLKPL